MEKKTSFQDHKEGALDTASHSGEAEPGGLETLRAPSTSSDKSSSGQDQAFGKVGARCLCYNCFKFNALAVSAIVTKQYSVVSMIYP